MKIIRQTSKPLSLILALFMLMISGPFQSAFAALIGVLAGLYPAARARRTRPVSPLVPEAVAGPGRYS